jgi:hypothetical protein
MYFTPQSFRLFLCFTLKRLATKPDYFLPGTYLYHGAHGANLYVRGTLKPYFICRIER